MRNNVPGENGVSRFHTQLKLLRMGFIKRKEDRTDSEEQQRGQQDQKCQQPAGVDIDYQTKLRLVLATVE